MILTWQCQFCGWANDNNNGPCHKCGGHTEMRCVKGKWREVTIKEPMSVREQNTSKEDQPNMEDMSVASSTNHPSIEGG